MTLLAVADRLLEHPTVRQFLLSFDETEWPDVVQSACVLGIQALLAKYGRGARLTDASLLRALARTVVRQGCWPFSLTDAIDEPDCIPLQPTPADHGRPVRRAGRGRGLSRNRRGGRSLPPGARVGTVPGYGQCGVMRASTARIRGKSAPPDLGPDLKILVQKARAQQANIRFPVAAPAAPAVAPPGASRLTERNLTVVAALQKVSENLNKPSAGTGEHTEVEGAEWYSRLMSRLQRLNSKMPVVDDKTLPPKWGEVPRTPPPEVDHGVAARGAGPVLGLSGSREYLRRQLQLNVDEEAPQVVIPREATPGGANPNNRSMMAGDPLVPGPPHTMPTNETASAPLDSKDASMLLCELPSREERREMHSSAFHDGPVF